MSKLIASVGNNGRNISSDVITVQNLLNAKIGQLKPLLRLKTDGKSGPLTIGLIKEYQERILGHKWPDGRVDPMGKTLASLLKSDQQSSTLPTANTQKHAKAQSSSTIKQNSHDISIQSKLLTERDYQLVSIETGLDIGLLKAVGNVEVGESSFFSGGPKILFEGHYFYRLTDGKYAQSHPSICYKNQSQARYGTYSGELEKLKLACSLNEDAALKSASWGRFQIMGLNHKHVGWPTIQSFVEDMRTSERYHLKAFIGYLEYRKLTPVLKAKNWELFARQYNGPDFKKNNYDVKLAAAYEAYRN